MSYCPYFFTPLTLIPTDGMIIIWAPSNTAHHAYGSEQTAEELQYEKEFWKPRTIFRSLIVSTRMSQQSLTRVSADALLCKFTISPGVLMESTSLRAALTTLHACSMLVMVRVLIAKLI